MNIHRTKTDNFQIGKKIFLRQKCKEIQGDAYVLDCFAGENKIWGNIKTKKYYGIEILKNKGKNLYADNLKVIPSLDLSMFNIIDIDTYGCPAKQIDAIYKNETLKNGTIIIYTNITNKMSNCPQILLDKFGIGFVRKKSKILANVLTDKLFYSYLYEIGISKVYEYSVSKNSYTKKYGYFFVKK